MLNILSHKGNRNQNGIETSSYPSQNGCHQEDKQQMLVKMQGRRNPYILLLEM
jgi:hypothetical protein